MKPLPNTVSGLIEQLDKMYPPRCIAPGQALDSAHRYAGRRDLIDELKNRLEATERTELKGRIQSP